MQQTRQYILDILKIRGEASVDEIVEELRDRRGKEITAVTVRHHLTKLQDEDLLAQARLRHRDTPGRPQHVYTLTEKAITQFPNNYQQLATSLLRGIQSKLPQRSINVILEDVADHMAEEANIPDAPLVERLDMVVEYLNTRGYDARWEESGKDYILHTSNCPYHQIASRNENLCDLDLRLVASLLGVVPRRHAHIMQGEESCAYLIPNHVQ